MELREHLSVVDVRSELEFQQGHVRHASNIPLLNNRERVIVGTAYKEQGQRKAIMEGFRLVGPRLNEIVEETERVASRKEIIVHCWRGGMRSANFAQFVGMAGIKSHVLEGGYKTYRQKAIQAFQHPFKFISITGCTGSGKSEILRELKKLGAQTIDLERLANHKGSAFGALKMPAQPTTEQFQNDLFEEILALDASQPVWIEDESIAIGKIFLPNDFWSAMSGGKLVQIDVDKQVRVSRLVNEYSDEDPSKFMEALARITKKLGGQNYKLAKSLLTEGLWHQAIEVILNYYDKAYLASIEKRSERISAIHEWDGNSPNQFAEELLKAIKDKVYSE